MHRPLSVLTLALFLAVACYGQQPPRSKQAKLPYGWSKIGLSSEQKTKAHAIITEANGKVAELQRQIDTIRSKEKADLSALLTDAQRAELRRIVEAKAGVDPKPTPAPKEKSK